MPDAICNTSPLLYLYRIGALDWLPKLFNEVWINREIIDDHHFISIRLRFGVTVSEEKDIKARIKRHIVGRK